MNKTKFVFLGVLSFTLVATLFLFQNCDPVHEGAEDLNSISEDPETSITIFEATLMPELTVCASCHGTTQAPLFAVTDSEAAHDTIVSQNLISFSDPASSEFVIKLQGGHQSFDTSLADTFQAQIEAWDAQLNE